MRDFIHLYKDLRKSYFKEYWKHHADPDATMEDAEQFVDSRINEMTFTEFMKVVIDE